MNEERHGVAQPRYVERRDSQAIASSTEVSIAVRRVSWGAILAGVIIFLVAQLLLSLLGVGVGVSTIDPTGESPEAASFGIGAGIWWVVSALVAAYLGGWVAGRLAGMPHRTDGSLHGVVTWGLATLLMFYVLTTSLSSLIGGAFGAVGSALQAAGKGGEAVLEETTPGMLSQLQKDIQALMGPTAQGIEGNAQQVQQAVQDPEVRRLLQKVVTAGPDSLSPADRQAAVNALVQHANMSPAQADQQITSWQNQYQQAKQKALQAAEKTADTVSQAAIWGFIALLLGAIVAALGGIVGAPRDLRGDLRATA